MSDAQIFQIFSVVYLAVGIGMLFSPEFYKKMISDFLDNTAILYMGGIMALVVGLLILMFHNTWTKDFSVIITIIGWLALIKGVIILILPKTMVSLAKTIVNRPNFMKIEAILVIIVGIFFSFLGFCPKSPLAVL
ncbi:MAG: hypothetical protein K9M75_02925 [Phycisphaerae bacterium]|nr:hypothetical protein [Phycisphaerae bacterium]